MTRLPSIRRWLSAAVIVGLVASATGCESDIRNPASVTIRYRENAPLTRDRLVVTVDDIENGWYFEGVDFEPVGDDWFVSRSLRLSSSAGVRVTVSLRGDYASGPDAAATGAIDLPATPSEQWRVDIFTSELAPEIACGGCAGLVRFNIADGSRPSTRDQLYVRWTGTDDGLMGPS